MPRVCTWNSSSSSFCTSSPSRRTVNMSRWLRILDHNRNVHRYGRLRPRVDSEFAYVFLRRVKSIYQNSVAVIMVGNTKLDNNLLFIGYELTSKLQVSLQIRPRQSGNLYTNVITCNYHNGNVTCYKYLIRFSYALDWNGDVPARLGFFADSKLCF